MINSNIKQNITVCIPDRYSSNPLKIFYRIKTLGNYFNHLIYYDIFGNNSTIEFVRIAACRGFVRSPIVNLQL